MSTRSSPVSCHKKLTCRMSTGSSPVTRSSPVGCQQQAHLLDVNNKLTCQLSQEAHLSPVTRSSPVGCQQEAHLSPVTRSSPVGYRWQTRWRVLALCADMADLLKHFPPHVHYQAKFGYSRSNGVGGPQKVRSAVAPTLWNKGMAEADPLETRPSIDGLPCQIWSLVDKKCKHMYEDPSVTRDSAIVEKPCEAFMEMQWHGWPRKSRPLPVCVTMPNLVVLQQKM